MISLKSTLQPAAKRVKNFQEISMGLPKKSMVDEALRCTQCHDAPCVPACPVGVDILGFIRLLREGDTAGALAKIREQNDLPAICGRVCSAPCEKACVFDAQKNTISIRALERYASDNGRPRFLSRKAIVPTGKKVAIIGSGPAGLTAASHLAKVGLKVTVFETLPLLGGTLRYGIPEFRLPKNVLDAEIEEIRLFGVEFKTNFPVGHSVKVEQFLREGYSAVLLTTGKSGPVWSTLPGCDAGGVYYAKEILMTANFRFEEQYRRNPQPSLGATVAIIGNNSDALDCSRICQRLGRQTNLIFAETMEDFRAYTDDLFQGQEEGIRIEPMTQALEVISGSNGFVTGVKCQRLDFAQGQGQDKWELKPVPGSEFMIEAQTVILATGFKTNHSVLGDHSSFKINDNGTLWADPVTRMTSVRHIFAAGDCVAGASLPEAMASGKRAAQSIIDHLHGQSK